jgi:hypothetical protein
VADDRQIEWGKKRQRQISWGVRDGQRKDRDGDIEKLYTGLVPVTLYYQLLSMSSFRIIIMRFFEIYINNCLLQTGRQIEEPC